MQDQPTPTSPDSTTGGEANHEAEPGMLAQISRTMVRLYKDQFGRGPTRARSDWCGRDLLVCTLEDTLTPTEKNLRSLGEDQRLRDIRMLFQYAAAQQFIQSVEEITGRRVRSFISGIDTAKDIAIETFVLYPEGDEGGDGSAP
jgi:uncharacterized protein YbcI